MNVIKSNASIDAEQLVKFGPEIIGLLRRTAAKSLCVFPQHSPDDPCQGCQDYRRAKEIVRAVTGLEFGEL